MRPRVKVVVPWAPTEVIERISSHLEQANGCPFEGQMTESHLALHLCDQERHFWSPWLDAYIEPGEGGTQISGRMTPHPSIWTGYMTAYAFLAFVMLAGAVFGYTQWSVNQSPWGFWVIPIAMLITGGVYASAFVGQRLSHDQMVLLRRFLYDALDLPPDTP